MNLKNEMIKRCVTNLSIKICSKGRRDWRCLHSNNSEIFLLTKDNHGRLPDVAKLLGYTIIGEV
jgi:hypothetical protein